MSPFEQMFDQGYGYAWWVMSLPYEDGTVRMFYAGGNGGQASITERVFDTNMPAEPIATKYVWHNELNDQALAHVDYGSAYDYLYLSLNVIANGGVSQTPLGSASVGVFDVTFSQVPEPGVIGLMLRGSAGLLIRRRRR